jgi:hypothetical protein
MNFQLLETCFGKNIAQKSFVVEPSSSSKLTTDCDLALRNIEITNYFTN